MWKKHKLPHSALSWSLSLAEDLESLSLQDRATKWHYYQSATYKLLLIPYKLLLIPYKLLLILTAYFGIGISQQPFILLNLHLHYQTIFYISLKWRKPQMTDDLKILMQSRRPPMAGKLKIWNSKSRKSQQPLFFNFNTWRKLKVRIVT